MVTANAQGQAPSSSPASGPTSPLAEADPESLDALFSMDPLDLKEPDIDKIVARLRAERERWNIAEAAGATRAPRATAKAPKPKADPNAPAPSLEDLGL